ncbi:MAG: SpoVR family protein, partial [Planctomycetes bacterium]|nr:SpoVR family protein [Planctomycetota bacterium]
EVRRIHNDQTFIDEFLTLDFGRRSKMFSFGYNENTGYYEIESRQFEKIKKQLLFSLTNLGRPIIYVRDGNYKNRGELFMEHRCDGPELKVQYAQDTTRSTITSGEIATWHPPLHEPVYPTTYCRQARRKLPYAFSRRPVCCVA